MGSANPNFMCKMLHMQKITLPAFLIKNSAVLCLIFSSHCMAGSEVLTVKIGTAAPPAYCEVNLGRLGKLALFRSLDNISTFSARSNGDSTWGRSGDTPEPTLVFLDVVVGAEVLIKPLSLNGMAVSGNTSALTDAAGLPIAAANESSVATWMAKGSSGVKLYRRNSDNTLGEMKSHLHLNGTDIVISGIETGRYALEVFPSFQFSAANITRATAWHQNNKDKHWPFEVTCTPAGS